MTAPAGNVTGQNTKVYFSKDFMTPSPVTLAAIEGGSKLIVDANLVKKVTEIGDVAQTGEVRQIPIYGEATQEPIPGPTSYENMMIECLRRLTDSLQNTISTLAPGTEVKIALYSTIGEAKTAMFIEARVVSVTETNPATEPKRLRVEVVPSSRIQVS